MEKNVGEETKETKFKIEPRGLFHKEYREMHKRGILSDQIIRLMTEDVVMGHEKNFEREDYLIDEVYQNESIRDWTQSEINKFFQKTMNLTWGREKSESEKN